MFQRNIEVRKNTSHIGGNAFGWHTWHTSSGSSTRPFCGACEGRVGQPQARVGYRQVWSGKRAVWGICGGVLRRRLLLRGIPVFRRLIFKQEKARCRKRPLCGLHRPAEPGGRARNCGLFRELAGVVKRGHRRGCTWGFGVKSGVASKQKWRNTGKLLGVISWCITILEVLLWVKRSSRESASIWTKS